MLKQQHFKTTNKMKQKNLQATLLLLAVLATASCSNETDPIPTPSNNPDAVELGITAGVALTKSVIDGGSSAQTGAGANTLKEVAVRATGDDYTTSNNVAVYTRNTSSNVWSNSADDAGKIWLTAKTATIYAFHPAHTYDTYGNITTTDVAVTGTVGSDATIPISLFEGGEAESGSPSLKTNSTITDANNSSAGSPILSAPGEVDYLWEGSDTKPTASNGKGSGTPPGKSVELNMKHALALVSFKIYKESSYKGTGTLTKIVLKNKDSGTALNKGTNATMNIQTGAITVEGSAGATFTRLIGGSGAVLASSADAAHSYSILVFPDASGGAAKNGIQAVFTIDGADYPVALAANTTAVEWAVGTNNVYTVNLSGTGLGISSVKVAAWESGNGGDLPIN